MSSANSDSGTSTSAAAAAAPPEKGPIRWTKVLELGYEDGRSGAAAGAGAGADTSAGTEVPSTGGASSPSSPSACCFKCGKSAADAGGKLSKCSKCLTVGYCSRDCQVADWKGGTGGGHKHQCSAYKRVGMDMTLTSPADKATARESVLQRIRFYACPYAVHKSQTLGQGFLFVQSDSTLTELSLPTPKLPNGRPMQQQRAVLLHYLTMGEFDSEVCREDFELASVRSEIMEAVGGHDGTTELIVLMRFRCGQVAVGVAPLVPDFGICKSLGRDYFEGGTEGALQLNLDDM